MSQRFLNLLLLREGFLCFRRFDLVSSLFDLSFVCGCLVLKR